MSKKNAGPQPYDWAEWSKLTPTAPKQSPVGARPRAMAWAMTSAVQLVPERSGKRGDLLAVRFGGNSSLCVKAYDAAKANPHYELLASHVLAAAGVRVPTGRLLTQDELETATPLLVEKYEHVEGTPAPRYLVDEGLMGREDLVDTRWLPKQVEEFQVEVAAKKAARKKAIRAGTAQAAPVAILEFVRGPRLSENNGNGGSAAVRAGVTAGKVHLGKIEMEAMGLMAAVDVMCNNYERLPVLLPPGADADGNLGNIVLEPHDGTQSTVCAIDSCVNVLAGAALKQYLAKIEAEGSAPSLQWVATAFNQFGGMQFYGDVLYEPFFATTEPLLLAFLRGWKAGLVKVGKMLANGDLEHALEDSVAYAMERGADQAEMDQAVQFVMAVAKTISGLKPAAVAHAAEAILQKEAADADHAQSLDAGALDPFAMLGGLLADEDGAKPKPKTLSDEVDALGHIDKGTSGVAGKDWKHRYCMLQGDTLYYYLDTDKTTFGELDIRGCTIEPPPKKLENQPTFTIVPPDSDRTSPEYHMMLDNDAEMAAWIVKLEEIAVKKRPVDENGVAARTLPPYGFHAR